MTMHQANTIKLLNNKEIVLEIMVEKYIKLQSTEKAAFKVKKLQCVKQNNKATLHVWSNKEIVLAIVIQKYIKLQSNLEH